MLARSGGCVSPISDPKGLLAGLAGKVHNSAPVRLRHAIRTGLGWDVIIRSFRGTVVRGHEADFYSIVRERLIAFRIEHALIESHIGRRMTPDGDTFLVTTHWPDWSSLRRWGDDDLERPWGFEEIMPHLASWRIEHFEEFVVESEDTPTGLPLGGASVPGDASMAIGRIAV